MTVTHLRSGGRAGELTTPVSLTMLVSMAAPTAPIEWSSTDVPFEPLRVSVTPLFVDGPSTVTESFFEYLVSLGVREDDVWPEPEPGCECEIDWLCPLHRNRRGTWIETRFEDRWDDEPWWATEREWAGMA